MSCQHFPSMGSDPIDADPIDAAAEFPQALGKRIPLGNVYGKAYREESHNGLAE